jgi:mannose-1-phosphate guanylyltransferase
MKHQLQAVIFCGGLGTRLRPITNSLPKPMVPISDKPFLEHLLLQLSSQGIKRFILLTGYMGELIHKYFGDGSPDLFLMTNFFCFIQIILFNLI